MKISLAEIEQRVVYKDNNSYGIVNYDIDNAYPQRVKELIMSSGTARQCADRYSRFIEGEGFVNALLYKAVVNQKGLTMDKLLRKLAVDYSFYRGFALHINYNALYQPVEFNIVSFEDCRLPSEDNEDQKGKIAMYADWSKRRKSSIKKDDIMWLNRYNPKPEVIEQEVEAAGGWNTYGGQVFWYSADGEDYPSSIADPVLEDIDTDAQIKTFRNNAVRSGFLDHMMLVQKGKFESEVERSEFKEDLKKFQGAKKSSQIFLVEIEREEEKPELLPMPTTEPDKKFDLTTRTTKDAIIEAFGIPPVLLNALVPGKLGTATEIQDAVRFYNRQTSRERILFEETAIELTKNFSPSIVPADGNYALKEFSF